MWRKISASVDGGPSADPGTRAPIGARGNCFGILVVFSTPKVSVFQSRFRINLKNVFIISRANVAKPEAFCIIFLSLCIVMAVQDLPLSHEIK